MGGNTEDTHRANVTAYISSNSIWETRQLANRKKGSTHTHTAAAQNNNNLWVRMCMPCQLNSASFRQGAGGGF